LSVTEGGGCNVSQGKREEGERVVPGGKKGTLVGSACAVVAFVGGAPASNHEKKKKGSCTSSRKDSAGKKNGFGVLLETKSGSTSGGGEKGGGGDGLTSKRKWPGGCEGKNKKPGPDCNGRRKPCKTLSWGKRKDKGPGKERPHKLGLRFWGIRDGL